MRCFLPSPDIDGVGVVRPLDDALSATQADVSIWHAVRVAADNGDHHANGGDSVICTFTSRIRFLDDILWSQE